MMNRSGKSETIAEELRREIAEQRLAPDTPLPPERQLAERFGVATVTAKRALDLLSEAGIVYRRPRSGTFVKTAPTPIPRIGLVAELSEPCTVNATARSFNIAPKSCYELLRQHECELHHISYRELREPELARRRFAKCDGLLLNCGEVDTYTRELLRSFDGPVVMFDNDFMQNALDCSEVIPDFLCGLREAFKRILPQRHSRIILIDPGHPNSAGRLASVRQALAEHGCTEDETIRVKLMRGDSGQMSAYREFLPAAPRCRNALVISPSDYLSFGVVEALRDSNLEPGRDLSLLSIDNVEGLGVTPYAEPFLTSVDMVKLRIVSESVKLLLSLLRTPTDCRHRVIVPTSTVFRKSTINFPEKENYKESI